MPQKILVVDDNQVLLKFVRNLLEREGHEVHTAEDGFAALNVLADYTPDIMIVDMIMPRIGGDKLCQIVRKMEGMGNCHIIILSAAMAELVSDPAIVGANVCIAKGPFAQMAQHILNAVEKVTTPGPGDEGAAGQVLGLESLYERQMTKELLSRNRHLDTILESISEGIVEIFDGRIVYVNSAAITLLGIAEEKLLAADPAALFSGETRDLVRDLLEARITKARTIGQRSPLNLNGRLVTIRRLPVKGAARTDILLISDITERQNLEMQLHHIQKMEAIGTIASGVAHNFRNTLAGILMNNQLIQMNHPEDPEIGIITARIESSVKRGAELVEGLMQFSRKQVRKILQPLDLVQVIKDIHQLIRKSFDQNIAIHLDLPETLPVMGDSSGLGLALLNLFTNARDSMPDGGTLTIAARALKKVAKIQIADTGTGMTPEILKSCFDPFFTTKRTGHGTGLGLSTAYGIIQNHDGKITVSSTPGKGSVFTLSIPLLPAGDRDILSGNSERSDIPRGNGEKVLVVDDEKDFSDALLLLLEKLGYRAAVASDAADALKCVAAWAPDAILMDRNLPNLNGLASAQRILEHKADVKIAILSGYEENGQSGIAAGDVPRRFHGYLTKPVGLWELAHQLKNMLNPGTAE